MMARTPFMTPLENRWLWRGLAAVLILGAAGLHVAYLVHNCPLDLAPDEAHYWDWSRHLDWSYYSKGPLVALLIRGSCALFGSFSESLTGNLALAIRLPAIACGALLLVSMYVLTVQTFGRERLAFALVALALTLPPVAALSTLMTIDSPYTACWGWALVFGHAAAVRGKAWAWPFAGLAVGIGILAKYTMVIWLPSVGLYLLTSPAGRSQLRRSGFWIACGIAGLCCLPILYWNVHNDWITVRHVGWQAGVQQRDGWRWLGPLTFVGGQLALLLGVWFVAWAAAMWRYRPVVVGQASKTDHRSPITDHTSYLWWLSAPMFGVFLLASLKTPGQLNWPVAAYESGGVLTAAWLADRLRDPRPGVQRIVRMAGAGAVALGLTLTLFVHLPALSRPVLATFVGLPTPERPLPLRRVDPTCRLRGWRPGLAAAVDQARDAVRAGGAEPVVAVGSWALAGELGVYCAGHPTVYTVGVVFGDRSSQYDLWRPNPAFNPADFRGRTFVLIGCVPEIARAFDAIESTRDVVYAEGDQPVQSWRVIVARGFRGLGMTDELLRLAWH
jgi:4-amino-4-deoxy-L-arabinose transferase-like glycosyltransferase